MAMMEEQMMMEGASMPRGEGMQMPSMEQAIPPEAMQMMMQPDYAITSVLLVRLNSMTEQDLALLDKVITKEAAPVLMKLLPEFKDIFEAISAREEQPEGSDMGALGGL